MKYLLCSLIFVWHSIAVSSAVVPGLDADVKTSAATMAPEVRAKAVGEGAFNFFVVVTAPGGSIISMLEELFASGMSIDARDSCGKTFLHWTSGLNGYKEEMRYLMYRGADLNTVADKEVGQTTPLHDALGTNNENAETLIEAGARTDLSNSQGLTAVDMVCFLYPLMSTQRIIRALVEVSDVS